MSYIPLGNVTAPEYGWVTAKADEKGFFDKRNQDYFKETGRYVDPSWDGWTHSGQSYQNQMRDINRVAQAKAKANFSFDTMDIASGKRRPGSLDLSSKRKIPSWEYYKNGPLGGIWQDNSIAGSLNRVATRRAALSNPNRFQGGVTDKTLDLGNPFNYTDPELQRYMDGPNANIMYRMSGDRMELSGNNTSKTWGGEDLADEVAQWYKQHNTDPNFDSNYGSLVSKNGNQYTFDKDGVATNYFYTPYDVAIHGTKQGGIANQDINFWNDKPFYDNGFLSTIDPGTKALGSETTSLGVKTPPKSGGLFGGGGLLSTLAGVGLNFLAPGAGTIFNGAINAGKVLDGPGSMNRTNPFAGFNPYETPNSNVKNTTTGNGTTPNILNPGTGGSNQTTTSLNKFNWNNEDFNVQNNGLYKQNGDLAYNREDNTGTSQLGQAYNTYLGTL